MTASDHEMDDDHALHSSSFLRPQTMEPRRAEMSDSSAPAARESQSLERPASQDRARNVGDIDDDDDDEDERPREASRERIGGANPFAMSGNGSAGMVAAPFAQQPHAPSGQSGIHHPADENLRVSAKCTARHCFRLQWEAEMNPRCREKTALNIENKIYLFDGFYILCHDDVPDVPQFEYTRDGVMCRIRFVREPLPQALLPPSEPGNPSITSAEGCETMFLLKRYLFQQLLNIQPMHLFQTAFGDPARATGDVSDYCSDFHLIPRFISLTDTPLLNKDDLLAPHRIGFAVGKFVEITHVLGCLNASAQFPVAAFLATSPARSLVDTIVSAWVNNVPGVFRVDELVYEDRAEQTRAVANAAPPQDEAVPPAPPQLKYLRHAGRGAPAFDGVDNKKKFRRWQELGQVMQVSPRVDPHAELLDPHNSHIIGLRADVFEVASAMPMVLKYIRHYKLLASFEADMNVTFKDKTLLRQAFTHGSYVDTAMQNVNTVEATVSRVRLGHVFENTGGLKRKRAAFLEEQGTSRMDATMDPEMKRVAEQHLTTDFQPQFHSKFLCPYERLEFLGDAVLSYLVASSSFLKLPHSDGESVLHDTRKLIANNAALGRVARDANFDVLMLTAYDLTRLAEKDTSKIAADCLEALLGAVYKDQGIDACRELLLELMRRHSPGIRDSYLLNKKELLSKAAEYVEIDRERFTKWGRERERDARTAHQQFTMKTRVPIRNTHLWLQALTHNSFKGEQIDDDEFVCTDPSYERIEFLGDAVLQVLASEFLVDALPNYQEHLLTQARSSMVKNTRLAVVARKAGYESFIRLGRIVKQDKKLYMEDVLADVFEATLGVVFLENQCELGRVRAILQELLFPLLPEMLRRREWMNPDKILAHHLTEWSRGATRRIECVFKKLASRGEHEHCVAVYINRTLAARAGARTVHEAKNRACQKVLHLYGLD